MSEEEEVSVEDLSRTTSPPLYFAYCPFVSVLFLFRDYFFYECLFSAPFHSSHTQFLSSDQCFRKTWSLTAFLN